MTDPKAPTEAELKARESERWHAEQEVKRQAHVKACKEVDCRACAIINGTYRSPPTERCPACKQYIPYVPEGLAKLRLLASEAKTWLESGSVGEHTQALENVEEMLKILGK